MDNAKASTASRIEARTTGHCGGIFGEHYEEEKEKEEEEHCQQQQPCPHEPAPHDFTPARYVNS